MSEPTTPEEVAAAAKPVVTTYKVKNFIDADKLKADLSYSLADMSNAFMQQPALFVEYSRLAAMASRQVNDLEILLEATETSIYRKQRELAISAKEKPVDAAITKLVAGDRRIIALKRAVVEAKQVEAIAKGAVEAFKQRRDMLIQQGADGREQMKGEMRLKVVEGVKERLAERIMKGQD